MNIITYRGPGMAGGLSNSVGQAWRTCADPSDRWWNIGDTTLQCLSIGSDGSDRNKDLITIAPELIGGHYKYCNDFLWPVLHNLQEHSNFDFQANRQYDQFNLLVADALASVFNEEAPPACFIHDYHFALLPYFLKQRTRAKSVFFWHIPWPKKIEEPAINSQLKNIALGLLCCEAVGFHTREYAFNFMQFVRDNLPEYICDWSNLMVSKCSTSFHNTSVLVAPLGIDYESWNSLAQQAIDTNDQGRDLQLVFSVDRADYTKGVNNRLQAIDYFFDRYPRWRNKISFVQSCGRTRSGLSAFDRYWQECHELQAGLLNKWGDENWRPLIWLEENLSCEKLSGLYSKSSIMLVNPVRDGLNLTAKEYVACQVGEPGVLVLSPGAGVWDELGNYALKLENPHDYKNIADTVNKALTLTHEERSLRMNLLRAAVQRNSLIAWWFTFKNVFTAPTKTQLIYSWAKNSGKNLARNTLV